MATIETSIDISKQLTIHTAAGTMSFDEIVHTIKATNERSPTKFILWDLTEASLTNVGPSHIEALVLLTQQYASLRKGGKTAFVVASDLAFGFGRMYDTQHKILASEIPHMTFRNKELALKWLLE